MVVPFAFCRKLGLAALLVGCASAPPPLPPPRDATGPAAPRDAMACAAVARDLAEVDARMRAGEARITADRGRDQAVAYVAGVLFPPSLLLLAADSNAETRQSVQQMYGERDALLARGAAAGCELSARHTPQALPERR